MGSGLVRSRVAAHAEREPARRPHHLPPLVPVPTPGAEGREALGLQVDVVGEQVEVDASLPVVDPLHVDVRVAGLRPQAGELGMARPRCGRFGPGGRRPEMLGLPEPFLRNIDEDVHPGRGRHEPSLLAGGQSLSSQMTAPLVTVAPTSALSPVTVQACGAAPSHHGGSAGLDRVALIEPTLPAGASDRA